MGNISSFLIDRNFRERVKKDPKGVLSKELGLKFEDQLKLIVIEPEPKKIYLVIPDIKQREQIEQFAKENPKKPLLQITLKALQDPELKKRLFADPKKVLKEECGAPLPNDWSVEVFEETAERQYLVLPPLATEELSEEEIQRVAGGLNLGLLDNVNWAQFGRALAGGAALGVLKGLSLMYTNPTGIDAAAKTVYNWIDKGS